MPISIDKLKRVRVVTIPWGDETISLSYIPRRWDASFVERHNALVETEQDGGRERYIFTLLTMLHGWDVTNDGAPATITEGLLGQFDDPVLLVMYLAIRRDIEASEEKKS